MAAKQWIWSVVPRSARVPRLRRQTAVYETGIGAIIEGCLMFGSDILAGLQRR